MGVQKARKQGSVIVRENVIVLYLAHEHSICYKRAAKYRTMTFSLTITDPCFLAFCTTIAFKSYIPPTFSLRRFFIYLYKDGHTGGHTNCTIDCTVVGPPCGHLCAPSRVTIFTYSTKLLHVQSRSMFLIPGHCIYLPQNSSYLSSNFMLIFHANLFIVPKE